jgi:hypothetical protein
MDESTFMSKSQTVRRDLIDEALVDWAALNRLLSSFNLKELYVMYNTELMLLRRETFLSRMRKRIRAVVADAAEEFLLDLQETRKPKGVTHE